MKLPLDSFEILGASPGASARDILMLLDRKLEHCEYSGLSLNTLQRRNKFLNNSCRIILDPEKRKELESRYQGSHSINEIEKSMLIESGDEIAGLLLLLESGHFEECLAIGNRFISEITGRPSQQNTDENDVRKIIGYATLEHNNELKSKRYFDSCARVLEKGLAAVRNRDGCEMIENKINKELEEIVPFRILDLISRDMGEPTRDKGLEYLDDFLNQRGGLDSESNLYIENSAFKSFFRQIRYFLTVQEQIDLYQNWCHRGSESACFLLGISLVASGFARRKPERLVEALQVLRRLQSQELEEMMAYISLLLGNVDFVSTKVTEGIDSAESKRADEVALGDLCNACREWLSRDVLEGYRDVEPNADLEAYFSDRDVTTFIEDHDNSTNEGKACNRHRLAPLDLGQKFLDRSAPKKRGKPVNPNTTGTRNNPPKKRVDQLGIMGQVLRKKWIMSGLVLALVPIGWVLLSTQNGTRSLRAPDRKITNTNSLTPESQTLKLSKPSTADINQKGEKSKHSASKTELSKILKEWLKIKQEALISYKIPSRVLEVASSEAKQRLEREVSDNKSRGVKQVIAVELSDLSIVNRKKDRIEAIAKLIYSDKSTDQEGVVVERTPKHLFEKTYIFLYQQGRWVLK